MLRPFFCLLFSCFSFFSFCFLSRALQAESEKSIYKSDKRKELYQSEVKDIQQLASASVAFFKNERMKEIDGKGFELRGKTYGKEYKLCPEEPFFEQKSPAFCSGVLIAPDQVLTAGHCLQEEKLKKISLVFGYAFKSKDHNPYLVPYENVYSIKTIITQQVQDKVDFAIIKLDRKVPNDHLPVNFHADEDMDQDATLLMLGYPSGLPLKVVSEGKIIKESQKIILSEIDSYQGNSGSPVFNLETKELVGILIDGEKDFKYDSDRDCYISYLCRNDKCEGEIITRTSAILKAMGKR